MNQTRMPYEVPSSPNAADPRSGSAIPSILVYQSPVLLGLVSLLIIALIDSFQSKAMVPGFKLSVFAIVLLGTSPIGFAMTRFVRMASALNSRLAFWLTATIGGSVWAFGFNTLLHLVVLLVIVVSHQMNGPLALYEGIYKDVAQKVFTAFPYFAVVLTPIHLIYQIRRRRALQRPEAA